MTDKHREWEEPLYISTIEGFRVYLTEPCWSCNNTGIKDRYEWDKYDREDNPPPCYHCKGKGHLPTENAHALKKLLEEYFV